MAPLADLELKRVIADVAQTLDELQVDYALMGGAAFCLIVQDPTRMTEDVDLVIHVDHRKITADRLTTELLLKYPSKFTAITHPIRPYHPRLQAVPPRRRVLYRGT